MKAITCKEMKKIDSYTINELKIPGIVLMERASLKAFKHLHAKKYHKFTIICGVGNNGGDGFALARHLLLNKKDVSLFIVGNLDKLTNDAKTNLTILEKLGVKHIDIKGKIDLLALKKSILDSDVVVDSIFGIGLSRNIEGIYLKVIDEINDFSKYVVAIDVPSGLNADTSEVFNTCVKANKTITFHRAKKGLLYSEYVGELIVEDIGIPDIATKTILNNKK